MLLSTLLPLGMMLVVGLVFSGGGEWEIKLGDQRLLGKCKETGSWSKFITEPVEGILEVAGGKNTLSVAPIKITHVAVMNLQKVVLRPTEK